MSIRARDFDRIINKLGFTTRDSGDLLAWFEHNGKKVAYTKRSHIRGRDLPFQHSIRQQMHLNQQELRLVLTCTLGREEYIQLLTRKGII